MINEKSIANLKPIQPGETRNPGGKPVNARNRVTKLFLERLADDFEEHGRGAIEDCRTQDPSRYVAIVASLLPKEFIIERPLEGMSDDELAAAIADIRARLRAVENTGSGTTDAPQPEPPGELQTIQ